MLHSQHRCGRQVREPSLGALGDLLGLAQERCPRARSWTRRVAPISAIALTPPLRADAAELAIIASWPRASEPTREPKPEHQVTVKV